MGNNQNTSKRFIPDFIWPLILLFKNCRKNCWKLFRKSIADMVFKRQQNRWSLNSRRLGAYLFVGNHGILCHERSIPSETLNLLRQKIVVPRIALDSSPFVLLLWDDKEEEALLDLILQWWDIAAPVDPQPYQRFMDSPFYGWGPSSEKTEVSIHQDSQRIIICFPYGFSSDLFW